MVLGYLLVYIGTEIFGGRDDLLFFNIVSITIPQIGVTPSLLIQAAEAALYQSQRKGRDTCCRTGCRQRTELKYAIKSSGQWTVDS